MDIKKKKSAHDYSCGIDCLPVKDSDISRSEEVDDIIERIPTGWAKIITTIVAVIIFIVMLLSVIIKYPDTISGQITITGVKAPVRIVSSTSGRLHLLVSNNAKVHVGQCIGYIEGSARFEDILYIDSICKTKLYPKIKMSLSDNLNLGSLSSAYNDFVIAYHKYEQLYNSELYDNMRRTLINQKQSTSFIVKGLEKNIILQHEIYNKAYKQFSGDSILFESGALSHEALEIEKKNLISLQQSSIEMDINKLNRVSEINGIDIELSRINLNLYEELCNSYNVLETKYNILYNELLLWKERYLLTSPINGVLEYLSFWRENMFIGAAMELFSISPDNNKLIGELYIPTQGAGKVQIQQKVNIKLDDYPYDEYGRFLGTVHSISSQTKNIEIQGTNTNVYLVEVEFPDSMLTNYNLRVILNFGAKGTGDIITEDRRLIQRLFDNIKSKAEK